MSLSALWKNHVGDDDLLEQTDFSILSWLAIGAVLQLLCQSWLPLNFSFYLPIIYLMYRLGRALLAMARIGPHPWQGIVEGRVSGVLPEMQLSKEGGFGGSTTSDGIVMFLLGARIHHPFGKLAPGVAEIDKIFKEMWVELDNNRENWSYLGKTATLFDTSDTKGLTVFWISYFQDPQGLRSFATSSLHRQGINSYYAKKYPHVGIMHETYYSPKGSWETIYDNCPPMGFGNAKYLVENGELGSTLRPDLKTSTMWSRMGRK